MIAKCKYLQERTCTIKQNLNFENIIMLYIFMFISLLQLDEPILSLRYYNTNVYCLWKESTFKYNFLAYYIQISSP